MTKLDNSEECEIDDMKEQTFDKLLTKKVGQFGKKQILLSMLLASFVKCLSLQSLSPVFTAGEYFLTLSLIVDTLDRSVVDSNFSKEGNE